MSDEKKFLLAILGFALVIGVIYLGVSLFLAPPTKSPTAPTAAVAPIPAIADVPTQTADQEKRERIGKWVMRDLWVNKGVLGAVYWTDLKKISEAYSEGDDDKAIKLLKAGARQGELMVFQKATRVIYFDENDGYIQVQPKGTGNLVWVLGKHIYEERTNKNKK